MCGIVAILSRPAERPTPTDAAVLAALDGALAASSDDGSPVAAVLDAVAGHAAVADGLLRGVPGVLALADRPALILAVEARLDQLDAFVATREALVEEGQGTSEPLETADIEETNAALVRAKDVLWALRRDRLRTAAAVSALAGRDGRTSALAGFYAVQLALSAIDRLEVRGRDSAGLHLFVWDHGLDLDDPELAARLAGRGEDPLYPSGAVRVAGGALSFVYKAAAEIGELGDNTAALRAAIRDDGLLHLALAAPGARVAVLGHTRWASVGIISEPNAHPVNSEEDMATARSTPMGPTSWPPSTATSTTTRTFGRGPRSPSRRRSPRTPRSSPRSCPGRRGARRPGGGVPADGEHVRRLGRHRARPAPTSPARCCWRSGGAGRACTSASPTT